MKFPSINQYIESLTNLRHHFKQIRQFTLIADGDRKPYFISGNNAVVFKVEMRGKMYALKCFIRYSGVLDENYECICSFCKKIDSPYIPSFEFLKDEIFVFDEKGEGMYFPAILCEWVEGLSLGEYVKEKCLEGNIDLLHAIAATFDEFALWLLSKEFAHGDLKQDNIIVTNDGRLVLLDFDGMFVPGMEGKPAHEFGSLSFQHPRREATLFNRHTDDYSLALISASLHTLSLKPELFPTFHDGENIIFNPKEILEDRSPAYLEALELAQSRPALLELLATLKSEDPVLPSLQQIISDMGEFHTVNRTDYQRKTGCTSYEIIETCSNGWSVARNKDGLFGFLDEHGNKVIDFMFSDAGCFCEEAAPVKKNGRWAYIGLNGYLLTPYTYEEAREFREGMSAVKSDGKWGFINTAFETCIPACYDDTLDFAEGMACVRMGQLHGFIDRDGNKTIAPQFRSARNFNESLACVKNDEGLYGYIDKKGKYAVPPQFTRAASFRGGRAEVEIGDRTIIITAKRNKNGECRLYTGEF